MNKTIRDVMTAMPHTIGVDQKISTAKEMMRTHNVRHLPVNSAGKLVGILTQRDVTLALAIDKVSPERLTVEDVYIPEPFVVRPTDDLKSVAATMAREKFGCALVMDGEKIIGIYTTVDACRDLAAML
ncbi:MAG: CBS domain-containing protein [Bdellovibrionota bacterium]|nr:MAG: CBS domain-containing protein [Bdellovibrionota bacterium]